jgi:hypothetical protein
MPRFPKFKKGDLVEVVATTDKTYNNTSRTNNYIGSICEVMAPSYNEAAGGTMVRVRCIIPKKPHYLIDGEWFIGRFKKIKWKKRGNTIKCTRSL